MRSANRLRVLHIIASVDLAEGGPIEHALQTGEGLRARGHRQDILSFDQGKGRFNLPDGSVVHAFGGQQGYGRNWLSKAVSTLQNVPFAARWISAHRGNYDVAIVSGLWNVSTCAARLGLPGVLPYILFTHGMLDPWFRKVSPVKGYVKQALWLINEGPLVRGAERVLFTCEEEQRLARTAFKPYAAREEVVAFGTADTPPPSPSQAIAFRSLVPGLGNRPYLLFLSRIHPKKGVDLLIEGFARRAAQVGDLDLVIAGPDPHGMRLALERIATDRGVASRIHWPGMLRDEAKWGAFHGCEAFILPSHQENFGIVVAEALACSRPVLISDKVNIHREITTDRAGLVETDSIDGVIGLIDGFVAMSVEDRIHMGERARASFLRRFGMAGALDDLERILLEAAAGGPRGGAVRAVGGGMERTI